MDFIIIASDGLWNVLSNQVSAYFVELIQKKKLCILFIPYEYNYYQARLALKITIIEKLDNVFVLFPLCIWISYGTQIVSSYILDNHFHH